MRYFTFLTYPVIHNFYIQFLTVRFSTNYQEHAKRIFSTPILLVPSWVPQHWQKDTGIAKYIDTALQQCEMGCSPLSMPTYKEGYETEEKQVHGFQAPEGLLPRELSDSLVAAKILMSHSSDHYVNDFKHSLRLKALHMVQNGQLEYSFNLKLCLGDSVKTQRTHYLKTIYFITSEHIFQILKAFTVQYSALGLPSRRLAAYRRLTHFHGISLHYFVFMCPSEMYLFLTLKSN